MAPMNPAPSLARRLCLGLLLLAVGMPALPQQPAGQYTVEVIVFRNGSQTGGALPGSTPLPGGGEVEPTIVSGRKLGGAASRLRSAGYRVLAHTAWTQGPTTWEQVQGTRDWNAQRGVAASRLGMTNAGVHGKFIFERGTYLHFGMDLVVDDGGQRYRLREVRQNVKVNEVQYFDHPAIGVIAVISAGP